MIQHIVITGGAGALGAAVVERFKTANVVCHITQIPEEKLKSYTDKIFYYAVDCANEKSVENFYQQLPRVDASIHLVGGFSMAPIQDISQKAFEDMFKLNTLTAFLCSREAVKKMRAQQSGGAIVNISARSAIQPVAGVLAYKAAKAAVAALTEGLAEEVKHDHILVNALLPSIMDTKANRSAMPNANFSHWPKVADVAEAIYQLCPPQNRLMSGACIPVYGQA